MANVNEIDIYSDTIDTIEEMIDNDNVFPIVQDGKVKLFLKMFSFTSEPLTGRGRGCLRSLYKTLKDLLKTTLHMPNITGS